MTYELSQRCVQISPRNFRSAVWAMAQLLTAAVLPTIVPSKDHEGDRENVLGAAWEAAHGTFHEGLSVEQWRLNALARL